MIHTGDCIEVMRGMEADSVDAVVTDPPYGLEFMGKGWDKFGAVVQATTDTSWDDRPAGSSTPFGGGGQRVRYGAGQSFQAWCEAWGREALRVTKPGGYLLAFGGTRTHHRLVCGLEDAGWIIRDELMHIYASGFPKSHNVSNSDRFCQCESSAKHGVRSVRDTDVPASVATPSAPESVLFPSLPLGNGAADSDPARRLSDGAQPGLEGRRDVQEAEGKLPRGAGDPVPGVGEADGSVQWVRRGASGSDGGVDGAAVGADGSGESPRPRSRKQRPVEPRVVAVERDAQGGGGWPLCDRCGKPMVPAGLGTALKPAHEPIILARKPLTGSVAENVERHGTGALNIDATRIPGTEAQAYTVKRLKPGATLNKTGGNWRPDEGVDYHGQTKAGRWPSNVLLSSPELFDEPNPYVVGSGATLTPSFREGDRHADGMFGLKEPQTGLGYDDSGGYSRFFRIPGYSQAEPPEGDPAASPSTHGGRGEYPTAFLIPKADRADREPIVRGSVGKVFTATMNDGIGGREHNPEQPTAWRENSHPTVKPTDLMRHLVRLVTPPGGTVLDCFAGSGSTILACELEGFPWIAIEQSEEYVRIMEARLNGTQRGLGLDVGAPVKKRPTSANKTTERPNRSAAPQGFRGPWKGTGALADGNEEPAA